MFKSLIRIAVALEGILLEVRELKQDFRLQAEMAKREMESGPKKVMDLLDTVTGRFMGGKKDG